MRIRTKGAGEIDETEPEVESDLRRRAAWLLGMLAIVAVLVGIVMTTLLHGGSSGGGGGTKAGPLDSSIGSPSTSPKHSSPPPRTSSSTSSGSSTASGSSSPPASGAGSTGAGGPRCPTSSTCILPGDVGGAVAAVNAYRTQHGQPAAAGEVGPKAQQCAVQNGNGCTGGWSETEVAKPDGASAVQKILQFAHLLDPSLKTFQVGWAYDPGAKLYYFAIVRSD